MKYKFMVYLNSALNTYNEYTSGIPFVDQNAET